MYFNIHSGSCAPAERDLPSLATFFSQTLSVAPALALAAGIGETRLPAMPFLGFVPGLSFATRRGDHMPNRIDAGADVDEPSGE